MTDSFRDLSSDKIRKLLEQYHPRVAFKILALSTLSLDQSVQGESSHAYVENRPRRITISKKASQQLRSWETERVRVPADEKEARSMIQKWREGGRVKTGDLVGIVLYARRGQRRKTE